MRCCISKKEELTGLNEGNFPKSNQTHPEGCSQKTLLLGSRTILSFEEDMHRDMSETPSEQQSKLSTIGMMESQNPQ